MPNKNLMIVLLIFVGMLLDTNPSDLSAMIYWRLFSSSQMSFGPSSASAGDSIIIPIVAGAEFVQLQI